ncbi:MAG: hypothetical protein H6737_00425 [Alphaproteobacteria bacterium]|nr:hypothetical protein [Alphaproteobacteria bacterium]
MEAIPLPSQVSALEDLSGRLDNATHVQRLEWAYSLGQREQLALFELARGNPITVDDVVLDGEKVFIHQGRNGLVLFNRFEKRFARYGDEIVGYNHNDSIGGPFNFLAKRVTGPGHYTAYAAPDGDGIWIDYRAIPTRRHPEFPPLRSNDHGLPALVFGNMVDVLRRASSHVLIGNAFKDKGPARTPLARFGSLFPTAPFVLVQPA